VPIRWVALIALVAALVACSSAHSSSSSAPATAAPTTLPSTTTTAPPSNLTVIGVSPGVEQANFYPSATVTAVRCGTSPQGPFVAFLIPPGGAGTPPGSAMTLTTAVVVVDSKAEVKDHTGKVLYEQDLQGVTLGTTGNLVLSLNSVTYIGGDRRSVAQGAINITGSYACTGPPLAFPGL